MRLLDQGRLFSTQVAVAVTGLRTLTYQRSRRKTVVYSYSLALGILFGGVNVLIDGSCVDIPLFTAIGTVLEKLDVTLEYVARPS